MAVRNSISRQAAEEEAEVDVLRSHLETRAQMTKKIEAALVKVVNNGNNLDGAVQSLGTETKKLQELIQNIRATRAELDRLSQQADSKNDDEKIIRMGPEKAGLTSYINALRRLQKTLGTSKTSSLRTTQDAVADLQRLIKSGNTQLEAYFDKLLRSDTPRSVEPLHYTTKNQPFPILSEDKNSKLGVLNDYMSKAYQNLGEENPAPKIYADVRGPYVQFTLANLAAASINTAKKKNPADIYRPGPMSGIGMYTQAIEGLFRAEFETICRVFQREAWADAFKATTQGAMSELNRTVRELNQHVKQHLTTDCFLAYEIYEVLTTLANNIEQATGQLKAAFTEVLKPIKDTAKSSLAELLELMKQKISSIATLPPDGAPIPIVGESVRTLQGMVNFLRPVSNIMISIGDGGWKSVTAARGASDSTPNLNFDVTADGQEIFTHYCTDTIEALFAALDAKARIYFGKKPVAGVFMANSITIAERMVRESELGPLLEPRLPPVMDSWRKKSKGLYMDMCKDVSVHLLDTIHTSRTQRPTSGQGVVDSASIMKALSSKDRDNIKSKFLSFNASFDDMIKSHKSFNMEPEVRRMFARDMQQTVEPLYNRFFDRYHEVDKGKGKYVKYDKSQMSSVFHALY